MRTAMKIQKPAYVIFSNKVLDALVEKRPSNKVDLLNIKGLGAHKVDAYGSQILDIVREYICAQNRAGHGRACPASPRQMNRCMLRTCKCTNANANMCAGV